MPRINPYPLVSCVDCVCYEAPGYCSYFNVEIEAEEQVCGNYPELNNLDIEPPESE